MKKEIWLPPLITILITACSPVDSVRVFDDKQAALVAKQFYIPHPPKQPKPFSK